MASPPRKFSRLRPKAGSEAVRATRIQTSAEGKIDEANALSPQISDTDALFHSYLNQEISLQSDLSSLEAQLASATPGTSEYESLQSQISFTRLQLSDVQTLKTSTESQLASLTGEQDSLASLGTQLSNQAISILGNLPALPNLSIRGILGRNRLQASRRAGRSRDTLLTRGRGLGLSDERAPTLLGT